jgi:hypothetical protein
MLVNCLRCNQRPILKNVYGQYTISCKCGIKQGHLFFNRNIAIDNWNKYAYKYLVEQGSLKEMSAFNGLDKTVGKSKDKTKLAKRDNDTKSVRKERPVKKKPVKLDAKGKRRQALLLRADTDYLSIAEAKDLLRVTDRKIYQACKDKSLRSRKVAGVLRVRKDWAIKWRGKNPPSTKHHKELLVDILG